MTAMESHNYYTHRKKQMKETGFKALHSLIVQHGLKIYQYSPVKCQKLWKNFICVVMNNITYMET